MQPLSDFLMILQVLARFEPLKLTGFQVQQTVERSCTPFHCMSGALSWEGELHQEELELRLLPRVVCLNNAMTCNFAMPCFDLLLVVSEGQGDAYAIW